ncbi:MAG TPA: transposase [Bacteroidetes bacterium]|nr:transposase [Bacteroidota bacterium]
MKTRRKYDQEFKKMAVELSRHREDICKLAEELDIKPDLLYRWRREAQQVRGGAFPGHGNPKQTEEQKEIAKLKKELRDTQMERDILKKAVSIFSRSDGKYSNS